jgi:hypothetical protein
MEKDDLVVCFFSIRGKLFNMKNLKKIFRIFDYYTFEQVLDKINEGKQYLHKGEENLPVDVSASICFLYDLEELFKSMVQSPEEYEFEQKGEVCHGLLNERVSEKHLHEFYCGLKILKAEMGMILTYDNIPLYQNVGGFVDVLLAISGE